MPSGRTPTYNHELALDLRSSGWTSQDIADRVGCTQQAVLNLVRVHWARTRDPRAAPGARALAQHARIKGGRPKHRHGGRKKKRLPAEISAITYTLPQWNETLGIPVEQRQVLDFGSSSTIAPRAILVSLPQLKCLQEPING